MPELLSGINTDHTPRERRGVKRLNYWVKDEEIYRQWFEYLAISPSYQLAHLHRKVGLTAEQAASKPKDFDEVLAVYDDLGPVQEVLFNTWLNGNAIRYFGQPGRQPKVEVIGYLGTSEDQQRVSQRALRNAERNWENEGGHPSRVLAIPDGLPFSEVVKQLKKLVKKSSQVAAVETMLGPKYPLLGQRIRSDTYQGYLKVVRCRAEFPDWPLWMIGLKAELSRTYTHQLGAAEDVIPSQRNEAALRSLDVMVNRAIARVKLLSENAARGKFPSLYDCPHAMDLDWGLILQSGALRQEWEQRTVKEQAAKNAHWLMMPLTFLSKDWLWFELNLFDALGNCDL
jgi:hypothetical protein